MDKSKNKEKCVDTVSPNTMYYRYRARQRYLTIMYKRKKEVEEALAKYKNMPQKNRLILQAYMQGMNSRECGRAANCSYTWANLILRGYGCDTSQRLTAITRDRVESDMHDTD